MGYYFQHLRDTEYIMLHVQPPDFCLFDQPDQRLTGFSKSARQRASVFELSAAFSAATVSMFERAALLVAQPTCESAS